MVTQTYNLNMIPNGQIINVHVSQYDIGREIVFNLYNGSAKFTPAAGTTATIDGTKPDNKGFSLSATISGSTASFTTTKNMCAVPGDTICEFRLMKNSQNVGTANFILKVERAGLADDIDTSETEIPAYIDAAQRAAEAAADSAEDAADSATAAAGSANTADTRAGQAQANAMNAYNSARDAEAWAKGTRGDTPIPSTDPAYENNAKYYAELAGRTLPPGTTVDFWMDASGHLWEQQTIDGVQQTAIDLGKVKGEDTKSNSQVTSLYTAAFEKLPISTVNARVCGNMTQLDFSINCYASNSVPEGESLFATLSDYSSHKDLRPYYSGADALTVRLASSLKDIDLPGAVSFSMANDGKVYISAQAGGIVFPTGAALTFSFLFINNK